jgi:hypothetical protein
MTTNADWIDCATLDCGTVSACLDGANVRISYTATDADSADDPHDIREAVEAKLGFWIETPDADDWSPAEGDGEAVQTVGRYEYQPTHEITRGESVTRVCLIDGVGYTRGELEFETNADWTYSEEDNGWLFQGERRGGSVRAL